MLNFGTNGPATIYSTGFTERTEFALLPEYRAGRGHS